MSDRPPLGPPWQVSDKETYVSLKGLHIPFRYGEPDFLMMEGSRDLFVAAYTNTTQLYEFHQDDGNLSVKVIDNGQEFHESIPYWDSPGVRLRIIIDPHFTPQRTIRFKEVIRDPPPAS